MSACGEMAASTREEERTVIRRFFDEGLHWMVIVGGLTGYAVYRSTEITWGIYG